MASPEPGVVVEEALVSNAQSLSFFESGPPGEIGEESSVDLFLDSLEKNLSIRDMVGGMKGVWKTRVPDRTPF